ncbi:O-antigen ligase family protein [Bradyrhizobium sp. RT3b]|uniref:O-antigen ligase family protein n=1 Tax=Bradyrhizobium sp. RT3b TaxID=3156334 RepID=UPI0033921DA3
MINLPQAAAWSFALAISASPIFVLVYGLLGLHGSGIFTASFLCLTVAGVAVFGSARNFRLSSLDIAFLAFIVCAAISFAFNPLVADVRELMLFAITLSAYVAGRLFTRDHISILRQACFWLSGLVVVMGVAVTLPFLVSDWIGGELGRPFIFGFDNAATAFSFSLGVFVIALLTSRSDWVASRWMLIIIALTSIATAVLAASMVRFTLLAILASVALCILLSASERKFALMMFVVLVVSIGVGWIARSANAKLYAVYIVEELAGGSVSMELNSWHSSEKPSYAAERNPQSNSASCESVNTRNSVAIRKQLYSDAFNLAPRAGLAGFGLMSFGQLGCFKGMSPHNDLLEAIVELGWLGGTAYLAMIILAPIFLLKSARSNNDMRFVCLLSVFMIMLSMIYGQISRDLSLFIALGLAASVAEKSTAASKNRELLQVGELA